MSFSPKTDFSGLARTGLEVVANSNGATNGNLEIPASTGDIRTSYQYGHVKNPHVEFKITAAFTLNATSATAAEKVALGKVHGAAGSASVSGPFALKTISASSGAGEEPTFSADLVQIEAGATRTHCIYELDAENFSPARHAQTYGAFTFEESDDLTLQHADLKYDCDLSPTTINGTPKASDAAKGKKTVTVTMWSSSDTEEPEVEVADGFVQTADWACTGSDSQMFVWTATFEKFLTSTPPATNQG